MFSAEGLSFWWVWLMYIAAGLVTLGLLYYPMRRASHWLHLLLLTPIAALMFAPVTVQPESEYWAPAVLVMIFEAEKQGPEGLIRSLVPLIITFSGFLLIGIAALLTPKSRTRAKKSNVQSKKAKQKKEPQLESGAHSDKQEKHDIVDDLTLD